MGRKDDDTRLVKTTVWMTASQRRALKVAAAMTDRGPSEVLREALDEYLAHAKERPKEPRKAS